MSVTYGFYNSSTDEPRKYSAEDISRVFDGLITDGIFLGYGDALEVTTDETSMQVKVGVGRAWFNHTWTHNDTALPFDIVKPTSSLHKRIDTIVVDVNPNTRKNDIKVISGEVSSSGSPVAPKLTHGENGASYQYPLADITVSGGDTVISKSAITNRRGLDTDGTPFVTSVVQSVSVDDLIAQWQGSFDEWFETVKGVLDGDAAGNLATRVLALENDAENIRNEVIEGVREDIGQIRYDLDSATMHRNIYRGKYLGGTVTDAQKKSILDGTFDDIYIGDYWVVNDVKWLVADIDYYANGYHHVLVIPEEPFFNLAAYDTLDTSGGYVDSNLNSLYMYSEYVESYFPTVFPKIFEEYMIAQTDPNTGRAVNGSWYGVQCLTPSEIMVYGTRVWSYSNAGSTNEHLFTSSATQLALFRLSPKHIFCSSRYWLSDVVSSTQMAVVLERANGRGGTANRAKVTSSYGVRPICMIVGDK